MQAGLLHGVHHAAPHPALRDAHLPHRVLQRPGRLQSAHQRALTHQGMAVSQPGSDYLYSLEGLRG